MKKGIHPNYVICQVTCTCGHQFEVLSTKESLRLEVCNKCHPLYTGEERSIDRGGKIDKFKKKYGLA